MKRLLFFSLMFVTSLLFSDCKVLKKNNCDCPHFSENTKDTNKTNL